MGRCGAPCSGAESVGRLCRPRRGGSGRDAQVTSGRSSRSSPRRIAALAGHERFEEAAMARDRLAALVRAAARTQRLLGLTRCAELVAARPTPPAGWELVAGAPRAGWSPPRARRAGRPRCPTSTPWRAAARAGDGWQRGRHRQPAPRSPEACCGGWRRRGCALVHLDGVLVLPGLRRPGRSGPGWRPRPSRARHPTTPRRGPGTAPRRRVSNGPRRSQRILTGCSAVSSVGVRPPRSRRRPRGRGASMCETRCGCGRGGHAGHLGDAPAMTSASCSC